MTCEEMRARWNDRLDGELPPAELAALDAHAGECAACGQYAREMAAVFGGLELLRMESDERAATLSARPGRAGSGAARREAPLRRWFALTTLSRAAAVLLAIGLALLWAREDSHDGPLGGPPAADGTQIAGAGPAEPAASATVALLGESAGQYLAVPQKTSEPNVQLFCLFTVLPAGGHP